MKRKILLLLIIFVAAISQHLLPKNSPDIAAALLLPFLFTASSFGGFLAAFIIGTLIDGISTRALWVSPILFVIFHRIIIFVRSTINLKLFMTKTVVISVLLLLYFGIKAVVLDVQIINLSLKFLFTVLLSVVATVLY